MTFTQWHKVPQKIELDRVYALVVITNKDWILLLGSHDSYGKLALKTKVTCPPRKHYLPIVTGPLEKVTCPQKKLPAVAGKNCQKGGVMTNKKPMG